MSPADEVGGVGLDGHHIEDGQGGGQPADRGVVARLHRGGILHAPHPTRGSMTAVEIEGTRNWSGNVSWAPVEVIRPAGLDDLRHALARARAAGRSVRPAGSRHSFTPLCATDGVSLDLGAFSGIRSVDGDVVSVGAGTPLHELNVLLDGIGRAVANLGDIDRQTISGAISTGTHGTGARSVGWPLRSRRSRW